MKNLKLIKHVTLVMLVIFSIPLYAQIQYNYENNLGHLTITPSIIEVSVKTEVLWTLELKEEVATNNQPILVMTVTPSGNVRGPALKLFDDGTHGDVIPNDRIFSSTKDVLNNKPTSELYVAITIPPTNSLFSNAFPFDVVNIASEESFQATLDLIDIVSDSTEIWLNELSLTEAQNNILDYLNSKDHVNTADLSDDNYTITAQDTNGVVFIISTSPGGSLGRPGGEQSLIANPLFSDYSYDGTFHNASAWENSNGDKYFKRTPYFPEIILDSDVSVDELKNLCSYSVISMLTHAGLYKFIDQPGTWFLTGQEAKLADRLNPLVLSGRVFIHALYGKLAITDKFISSLDGEFPNSLILISACNSLTDASMAMAFLNKGAGAYLGWNNIVWPHGAAQRKEQLLQQLVDERKTIIEAYSFMVSNGYHIDPNPQSTPAAELKMIANDPDLVIYNTQPYFEWVEQAGMAGIANIQRSPNGLATDGSGNIVVTGSFWDNINFGSITLTSAGCNDIFIAKYNLSGSLLWAKRAGGSGCNDGFDIATDGSGNSIITGSFYGTSSFGSTILTSSGEDDIFVAKYDPSGNVLWAKKAGGSNYDAGYSIDMDGSDNCIITGRFSGIATFGSTILTSSGEDDIFIAKYNPSGDVLWAKRAGGTYDYPLAITIDGSGNSIITGGFWGTATFGSTTISTTNDSSDIFIAKYNPSGDVLWAKRAGGTGWDHGAAVAIDGSGNSIISGRFEGTATFGSTTLTRTGSFDIFLAKYNPSGDVLWARLVSGCSVWDSKNSLAADGLGNSIITGGFWGTATFGSTTLRADGWFDIFIAKYNQSGDVLWAKRAGGTGWDYGDAVAIDGSGNSIISGRFEGISNFDVITLSALGDYDIFIAKLVDPLQTIPFSKNVVQEKSNNNHSDREMPTKFSLYNNYPNPFNPETNIQFSLPDAGQISLRVYDLLGRVVNILFEGDRQAGYHAFLWNGKDKSGLDVASGIYIYRLEVTGADGQEFIANKKMILIR